MGVVVGKDKIRYRVRVQVYIDPFIYKIEEYFVNSVDADDAIRLVGDCLSNNGREFYGKYHDFFVLSADCF